LVAKLSQLTLDRVKVSILSASSLSSIDSDLASDRSVEISFESPMELAMALVAGEIIRYPTAKSARIDGKSSLL
jgi:hypothetical protein